MADIRLDTSELRERARELKIGDRVLLSGTVYTARDAAHKKFMTLLDNGEELPFNIDGACIYYCGPTPTPDGLPIGSAGPTTSGRMDPYTPRLLDLGLSAMIGKGVRSDEVVDAIARNSAVYFVAIGGAGALYARCVDSLDVIAFPELGCESVKRINIVDMPLIVAVDSNGNSLFK